LFLRKPLDTYLRALKPACGHPGPIGNIPATSGHPVDPTTPNYNPQVHNQRKHTQPTVPQRAVVSGAGGYDVLRRPPGARAAINYENGVVLTKTKIVFAPSPPRIPGQEARWISRTYTAYGNCRPLGALVADLGAPNCLNLLHVVPVGSADALWSPSSSLWPPAVRLGVHCAALCCLLHHRLAPLRHEPRFPCACFLLYLPLPATSYTRTSPTAPLPLLLSPQSAQKLCSRRASCTTSIAHSTALQVTSAYPSATRSIPWCRSCLVPPCPLPNTPQAAHCPPTPASPALSAVPPLAPTTCTMRLCYGTTDRTSCCARAAAHELLRPLLQQITSHLLPRPSRSLPTTDARASPITTPPCSLVRPQVRAPARTAPPSGRFCSTTVQSSALALPFLLAPRPSPGHYQRSCIADHDPPPRPPAPQSRTTHSRSAQAPPRPRSPLRLASQQRQHGTQHQATDRPDTRQASTQIQRSSTSTSTSTPSASTSTPSASASA
jgi:hypothetical protein